VSRRCAGRPAGSSPTDWLARSSTGMTSTRLPTKVRNYALCCGNVVSRIGVPPQQPHCNRSPQRRRGSAHDGWSALLPPADKMRAGIALTDQDRWPWLQALAAVIRDHVSRHVVFGQVDLMLGMLVWCTTAQCVSFTIDSVQAPRQVSQALLIASTMRLPIMRIMCMCDGI